MRLIAVMLMLLLVLMNVQCNRAKEEANALTDFARIQGNWALVSGERNGEKFTAEVTNNVRLVFVDNALKTHQGDEVTEAIFTLHPDMNPKGIDLDMDGSVGLGIYKLEGDKLTIVHGEIDQPRPADFGAVKNGELTVLVLQKSES
jgi:uncharacterized protein (TIGR03067 family)